MRHSQFCLGVFVLLLIANCEAKNVHLEHSDFSPTEDSLRVNDEESYINNSDKHQNISDEIGSGEYTPPTSDEETEDVFQGSDNDTETPDVKVMINGSKENNQATVLVCQVRGVPAQITFSPWVHMWGDIVIRDGLHGIIHDHINKLLIYNLSLQDMGTYICGIEGTHDNIPHNASQNLKITGVPTILRDNTIFHGKIGHPVSISIPFYSDPAIESFYILTNGTVISNTVGRQTYLLNESISYLMYGNTVKIEAQMLQFVILNSSQSDYKNYTLFLTNRIGRKEFIFQLFEDNKNIAAIMKLLFAGLAALAVVYIGLTVTVFQIKRRRSGRGFCRKQGNHSRERCDIGIEIKPVNVYSVMRSEVTGEREDIRAETTNSIYYSEISDIRVSHSASQDFRPAENSDCDKIHTYGKSHDRTYNSLNSIKRRQDARFAHSASQDFRPAENSDYDKIHTYGNSHDWTYCSLNPIKRRQGVKDSDLEKRQRQKNIRPISMKLTQTVSEL